MVDVAVAVISGLLVAWGLLVVMLWVVRPGATTLGEVARLLPDLLKLVRGLARDAAVPRPVRVRLWLLLAYLAMPLDLVPDFIPVVGFADDAIIVAWVLRSVVRSAGPDKVADHWPGSPDGLRALRALTGTIDA
jgi:uncharacterized membrane protein YkvA (DUF1232 family)